MPLETRKRKQATPIEALQTPNPSPPLSSPHLLPKPQRRSQHGRSRQFWNSLSRLWLTRRALREFDRRRRSVKSTVSKRTKLSDLKGDPGEELKRFARHGGPRLRDLRGYLVAASVTPLPSSRSCSSCGALSMSTEMTKKLTAYDDNFEQALNDSGIFLFNRGPKPENWEELKNRLGQRRPSLEPSLLSERDFESFQEKNRQAGSEAQVMSTIFPIFRGDAAILSGQNRLFKNLEPLNTDFVTAQPDFYDGSRPSDLDLRVRKDLGRYIVPSKKLNALVLPNFFMEAKGPGGNGAVLKRQITQDAAFGARGMFEIQSYCNGSQNYNGNAYTIVSTYFSDYGLLQLFIMHPTRPDSPASRPNYHLTTIKSFILTESLEVLREGLQWFRNSRDLAKEFRDDVITRANGIANASSKAAADQESPTTQNAASDLSEATPH